MNESKLRKDPTMAGIGEQTRKKIIEGVDALFESYQGIIESVYLKSEKDLKISFPVSLSPGDKPDDVAVNVEISFSTGKIKDKISLVANERQETMFKS
jgi:hypothetical protein